MARIVVKPIPRKKFNVRVGGKLFKLTLNKRNYNASMPNHYPNTRVGLLENRVKTLEDNPPPTITLDDTVTQESTNGVKSSGIWAALQALLQSVTQALAKLFIPTKTSELENDSNFITSSSLTKANIEGLKDTDSSTFADTLIPALADPASYDPATVAYLTELFGELSDSVKESILRTWGRLQDITNKVAGLQDGVIWEEVFEHDITTFELSVDKDGKQLDERGILILVDGVVSSSLNNGTLRLNSIDSSTYWNSVNNGILNSALIYCNGVADNIFSGTIQCYRNNNNIIIQQFIGNSYIAGGSRTNFYTASLPVSQNITNIELFTLRWRAGSQIKIYRL